MINIFWLLHYYYNRHFHILEPLGEIVTHIGNKYAAIHADIERMRDTKDLSFKEVKAQIQTFLTTWSREELLTLVNLKVDEEIMDKYNIVTTKKELKECRAIIKALKRENRELERVISSCENAFAKLRSEEVYICPRTKVDLTSNPRNSPNNGYEIANSTQYKRFPKMKELDQLNLFEPYQTLDKPNASNLSMFECLIKQLEGCVAKQKQAHSSMTLKRRLIQECFQRFPRVSLNDKNNVCQFWSAEDVTANEPMKIVLQRAKPMVKGRNKRKLCEVSELQDHFTNSGQIHPLEDDTTAGLHSHEMETGKTIAFTDSIQSEHGMNMKVKSESESPIIENANYKNLHNNSSRQMFATQVTPECKKENYTTAKLTKYTVGIGDASPIQEVFVKEESPSVCSQQMPTTKNMYFPDFSKTLDCPSGMSYYKKIQRIVRPRRETTKIPNKATGLENFDLAKQSSILNNLLRNNSDAALRALNKHYLIDKIDYRGVDEGTAPKRLEDGSNCAQNSDSSVSQMPADTSIKLGCPNSTPDTHKIMPNVCNASPKSTDAVNCCKQITLSTKPSCYDEADTSPLVKEVNLHSTLKNTTEDLSTVGEKDASWTPVKIFHEKRIRGLKKLKKVAGPVYQNYVPIYYEKDKSRTIPNSRVNIIRAVDKDHPYSSKLINVHLQPIPVEVDLASIHDRHEDAVIRQPTTDHRQTLNHVDPFVQSSATISPQLGSTQMDAVDKKHKSDDSTLGLGVNGIPIKKIKLSFRPLQTSERSINIDDESINLTVKTPIKCYSRTSSPKRNDINISQLVTVVPQNSMESDKPQYLMEIDGSKVDTTAPQVETVDGMDASLYQVEDSMPQIVSVTSLSRSHAKAVFQTEASQTLSENEPAKTVPPIEAQENLPHWCVELLQNTKTKPVKIVSPRTQKKLTASQTQEDTITQLKAVSPQAQMVPPNSSQSQMVPPDSQQSQMVPPNSLQSTMVAPDSPQSQIVPSNIPQSSIVPPDSSQCQMVPPDSPQCQMVPPNSQHTQMIAMNAPQTAIVPPNAPQSEAESNVSQIHGCATN